MQMQRISPDEIRVRKKPERPIVCLTAYTTSIAEVVDRYCDLLLVGDSLGMVLYGLPDTTGVSLDMMIRHGQGAMRGAKRACVVVDMPFGTYEDSPEQALKTARHITNETRCSAVKLEGGQTLAPMIEAITQAGIAVMGHIGLQPQSAPKEGGFKIKGKNEKETEKLLADAKAVEQAGAFSVVIEGTIEPVSHKITESITIPTIGIGASPACDGQILVTEDLLGITPRQPKFVKKYADLRTVIDEAAESYAEDVRNRKFPGKNQVYT